MALNPWEHAIRGLVFGGGTVYGLKKISGLTSRPDAREETIAKAETDGSYVFAAYIGERRVMFEGDIRAPDGNSILALSDALGAAFDTSVDPIPLDFNYPNPSGLTRRVNGNPTRINIDIDNMFSIGYAEWQAEFVCGDPAIYTGDSSGAGTPTGGMETMSFAPGISGGLDFGGPGNGLDFGGPGGGLDFGGGGSGTGVANNIGNNTSYPIIRIHGPAENPKLRNQTTDELLGFVITLTATDYLDIDMATRTVVLNGDASRYNTLDPAASTFWGLVPGNNTIQFVGTGTGPNSLVTVSWRAAWR